MSKFLMFLPPICALALLGAEAYSQTPAAGANQSDAGAGAQVGVANSSPSPSAQSDWSAPSEPQLGPFQESPAQSGSSEDTQTAPGAPQEVETYHVQTDGTAQEPTIEWRPSADSSDTDQDADAQLAPRVDLAGPGTPKWKVITYVTQTTTIDDNIYISHADKQADVSFAIAPGFAAGWGDFRSALLQRATAVFDQYGQTREPANDPLNGDFVYINYTASASHYVSHDSADAIDQDGEFSAQWDFTKLLVGLTAHVQTLSGPEIDLGTRTRRTLFNFAATANYTISDKTSFDFDADGSVSDYVTDLNSTDWHAQFFANYQIFPKTTIGAGVVAGIRTLQDNPDQEYQQGLLRATYNATDRLTLRVNGGLEIDESNGGSTRGNPVFGLGVIYTISDQDTFSMDASRSTSSSAVTAGETADNTTVDLSFHHRIYSNFSLGVSFGYQHVDYYNQGLSSEVRTDNYIFFRPSLAYDFAQWSQIELAYEYHRDVSSLQSYDFGENIASLQFNFVF